jgi:hypothetical protein
VILEPRTVEKNVVYTYNNVFLVSQNFLQSPYKCEEGVIYPYGTLVKWKMCFSKLKSVPFLEYLASSTWRKDGLRSKVLTYLERWKLCNGSLIGASLTLTGVIKYSGSLHPDISRSAYVPMHKCEAIYIKWARFFQYAVIYHVFYLRSDWITQSKCDVPSAG